MPHTIHYLASVVKVGRLVYYWAMAKIEIDTRTIVRVLLVVIGFGLALFLLYSASTGLLILGISIFLALALNSPVSRIARRLPGKSRVGATALAYIAVILILGAIIFVVIPPIIQQTAKFFETIPSVVHGLTEQWQGLRHFVEQYNLQSQLDGALASIQSTASGWAGNVGQVVLGSIGSIFGFMAGLILVLVLTFLMLVEGPRWIEKSWTLYSDKEKMQRHRRIIGRMYSVVNGYVTGQLTVSAIGAAAAGIVVFVLSLIFTEVPSSLAMTTAAITFILSLIPMFGATIGGLLVTVLLAFNNVPAAVIYAIYFVVYQQIENNFIAPHIQAKRNNLSALAILAAVTIGLYMFGILGGIIAIPIAGCIAILIDEWLSRRSQRTPAKTT